MRERMTETLFWFFLVIGPLAPGTRAPGILHPFETRQACWIAHAQLLGDKNTEWLQTHLVTPCGTHPALLLPRPDNPPELGGGQ